MSESRFMRQMPLAANTLSATILTPEEVHTAAMIVGQTLPAGLSECVTLRDLPDSEKPKSQCIFKVVSATDATLLDPSDFEQGDSVIDALPCSPHYLCQPVNLTAADLAGGLRRSDLLGKQSESFGNSFWSQIAALFQDATFATAVTTSAGSFGLGDSGVLQGALKTYPRKNLTLRADFFAALVSNAPYLQRLPDGSWSGGGWDRINVASDWSGAAAQCVGIAWSPSAVVLGTGIPLHGTPSNMPRSVLSERLVVPGLEAFKVSMYQWYNLQYRAQWCSIDGYVATAVADKSAAVLLKSS
jgi:hypothetical protein